MIKILDSEDNRFYFVICDIKGQIICTSETFQRKDIAIDCADMIVEMIREWTDPEMQVGDFTRRKKPGPKPKAENGVTTN